MKFHTPLAPNHLYFGTGNTFSRSLFVYGFLQNASEDVKKSDSSHTQDTKSFLFFEDFESIRGFKKTFE